MKEIVQIGIFAVRKTDGTFKPSIPLFVETQVEKSGLTKTQENAIKDVAGFFVEKMNESETAKQAV